VAHGGQKLGFRPGVGLCLQQGFRKFALALIGFIALMLQIEMGRQARRKDGVQRLRETLHDS